MYVCVCVGSIVPFSNPSGTLIFVKDLIKTIYMLINYETLEVCAVCSYQPIVM